MKSKFTLALLALTCFAGLAHADGSVERFRGPIIPIPIPVPVPVPGPGARPLACFARDSFGHLFQANGRWANRPNVERRALDQCFARSAAPRTCMAAGCN